MHTVRRSFAALQAGHKLLLILNQGCASRPKGGEVASDCTVYNILDVLVEVLTACFLIRKVVLLARGYHKLRPLPQIKAIQDDLSGG